MSNLTIISTDSLKTPTIARVARMTKRPGTNRCGQERPLSGGPNEGRAMTDTTKPNGDRDRPSDREAAKNPCGPAMGPPEGTASSGSTSPPLDMALLRELADEFGYRAATTDDADIERHRRLNAIPDGTHRWDHLKAAHVLPNAPGVS